MSSGISMMKWQKSHMASMKKEEGAMDRTWKIGSSGNDCEEEIRKKIEQEAEVVKQPTKRSARKDKTKEYEMTFEKMTAKMVLQRPVN